MTRQQLIKEGERLGCPHFMGFLADCLGLEPESTPTIFALDFKSYITLEAWD